MRHGEGEGLGLCPGSERQPEQLPCTRPAPRMRPAPLCSPSSHLGDRAPGGCCHDGGSWGLCKIAEGSEEKKHRGVSPGERFVFQKSKGCHKELLEGSSRAGERTRLLLQGFWVWGRRLFTNSLVLKIT